MNSQGKTTNSSAVGLDHVCFNEEAECPSWEHASSQGESTDTAPEASRQLNRAKEPYRLFMLAAWCGCRASRHKFP
jgi:hypothetical protein